MLESESEYSSGVGACEACMPMKVRTERRRTQIHSGGHTTAPLPPPSMSLGMLLGLPELKIKL